VTDTEKNMAERSKTFALTSSKNLNFIGKKKKHLQLRDNFCDHQG